MANNGGNIWLNGVHMYKEGFFGAGGGGGGRIWPNRMHREEQFDPSHFPSSPQWPIGNDTQECSMKVATNSGLIIASEEGGGGGEAPSWGM